MPGVGSPSGLVSAFVVRFLSNSNVWSRGRTHVPSGVRRKGKTDSQSEKWCNAREPTPGSNRIPSSEPAPPLTKPTNTARTKVSTKVGIATLTFLASLAFTCSSTAQDTDWAMQTIETFEAYCLETRADHELIVSMVSSLELIAVPDDLVPLIAGPDSTYTSAYFVEWNKGLGVYIMLGASQPDACSIFVYGLGYDRVEATLKEVYRLVLGARDDVGLQVSEMYVPWGVKGTKDEMFERGVVAVSYSKHDVSPPGFSLSYMPPKTARAVMAR